MLESSQATNKWKSPKRVRIYLIVVLIFFLLVSGYERWVHPALAPCEWLDRALKRSGCLQVVTAHDELHGRGYNIGLEFSKDGKSLVSGVFLYGGSEKGGEQLMTSAELWTVADNQLTPYLDWTTAPAYAIALSPTGTQVAVATSTGVEIWDAPPNTRWSPHRLTDTNASQMAFSPDGSVLATRSGAQVKLWRISDGTLLHTVPMDLKEYQGGLSFSPDGTLLAIGDDDGISLWRVSDMTLVRQFAEAGHSITFSNDGTTLAAAVDSTDIWLWRVSDGVVLLKLKGHPNTISSLAFSPDDYMLASASGAEMRWWRLPAGELLQVVKAPVDTVAFFPQGNTLAVEMDDNNISLWHTPEP